MGYYDTEVPFSELIGKTILKIEGGKSTDELTFTCLDKSVYNMRHDQSCCEHVYIEDICGELDDLIGFPIVQAEESSNSDRHPDEVNKGDFDSESFTWTFYRIATAKGLVVIRWYGSSNGYYGESANLYKVKNENID